MSAWLRELIQIIRASPRELIVGVAASLTAGILTQSLALRLSHRRKYITKKPIEMQLTETLELLQKNSEHAATLVSEFRAQAAGRMKGYRGCKG